MQSTLTEITEYALSLRPEERLQLANQLWLSLDEVPVASTDTENAWREELSLRMEDLNSGTVDSIPLETVLQRMETRVQQHIQP